MKTKAHIKWKRVKVKTIEERGGMTNGAEELRNYACGVNFVRFTLTLVVDQCSKHSMQLKFFLRKL